MHAIAAGIDRPGALSIVVQGHCGPGVADRVADNCGHWRGLFPAAQLICVISSGHPPRTARARLTAICDLLIEAPTAEPLPPMKIDSPGPNHVNLMIAAACAGLSVATGRRALRVRNDLTFGDRSFLDRYAQGQQAARGDRAVFAERILIAEVFTLNPFTVQRLPFHFSDWFHFGLTTDLRALWAAVTPMSRDDGTFYARHPHRAGSNAVERHFLARLAPEQIVGFPVFARAFPHLVLSDHNDPASAEESVLVLADNFVLADLRACSAAIPKYQHIVDRMRSYTRLECLNQRLLDRRIAARHRPAGSVWRTTIWRTWWHGSAVGRGARRALALVRRGFRPMLRA